MNSDTKKDEKNNDEKGMKRTNYWMREVGYFRRNIAQQFIMPQLPSIPETYRIMSSVECSCNCYGGCSGGDCSSCSYGNS